MANAHTLGQHDPVLGQVRLHDGQVRDIAESIAQAVAGAVPSREQDATVRLDPAQFARLEELLLPGYEASKLMLAQLSTPKVEPQKPAARTEPQNEVNPPDAG